MLHVEQGVEGGMEGLDLRFARSAKETMPLSEVDGVMQHMQLRESGNRCLRSLVLMNVAHDAAPCIDDCCSPLVGAEQAMMQLLQPAREDGVGSRSGSRDGRRCSGSSQHTRAAFLLDPLADLRPIEVV